MFDEIILNEIFKNRLEKIEENISQEYHKRIKYITIRNKDERENIKMNIIGELYYKQGFKDGLNFTINSTKK